MSATTETTTAETAVADEAAIRELIGANDAALSAADADAIAAKYAPDATVFDLAPPLGHGAPTADDLRAWLATFEGGVGNDTTELRVTVGGDVAFAHSLNRMRAVGREAPGAEPEPFELWFRSTVCLRRDGDPAVRRGWRVAHEHTSTPFHMDGSFRAAIDLTP